MHKGELTVSVEADSTLTIRIKDNGVGIESETLKKLNSGNYFSEKYGIRNINERIKLSCGDSFGIHFTSHSCTGTTVTVTLPIRHQEDIENV